MKKLLLSTLVLLTVSTFAFAGNCRQNIVSQNYVQQKAVVARVISPHQQLAVTTYDYAIPQNIVVRQQVVQEKVVQQKVQQVQKIEKVVTRQPLLNRLGQALQNAFPVRQRVVQQQIIKHH